MKKVLLFILAAASAVTLASCGKGIKVEKGTSGGTLDTERAGITKIEYPVRKEDSGLIYTVFEDSVTVAEVKENNKFVEIPETFEGKPVTAIASTCKMAGVVSVVIPESVTILPSGIFDQATPVEEGEQKPPQINETLKTVEIKCPISALENDMFSGCTALESVTLPQTLSRIGLNAFEGCTSLETIVIPDGVTEIGESAFKGCTSLKSIAFTEKMTTVENYCFKGCTALTSVTVPSNIVYIGVSSFEGCTALANVDLPAEITMVDRNSFSGTAWLDSFASEFVIIGDGNLIVYKPKPIEVPVEKPAEGEDTAGGESGTSSEDTPAGTPETVTSYPSSVTIPDGVKRIIGAFSGHTELTYVSIPESVIEIANGSFSGCTGLTSVKIPTSVKSIGESAFERCTGMSSLAIPSSVEVVRDRAFANSGLTYISFSADISQIGNGIFEGLDGLTVSCPDGSDMMNYCRYNGINTEAA